MADEGNKRDYKGWISLIIGALAVWVAYESFAWQKNQAEKDGTDSSAPGQQSTDGSNSSSSPDTYQHDPSTSEPEDKPAGNGKHDKGNKDKKNR